MLPRDVVSRSWRPLTKSLALPSSSTICFASILPAPTAKVDPKLKQNFGAVFAAAITASSVTPQGPKPVIQVISCPTPLIDAPQQEDKAASDGSRQSHGRNKHHRFLVRHPGVDRQVGLELARVRRGPETPTFPDGAPFQRIRKQHHLSGYGHGAFTGGRKHKMYFSLKRGR